VTQTETEDRRRRSLNTNSRDMLLSMAVIVGLVVALLLLVPRPDQIPERTLDVTAAASAAQTRLGFAPANPRLPEGWVARAASVQRDTDNLLTWHLTYTTPSGHYAGVQQTAKATPAWEARQVTDGREAGTRTIGGYTWIIRSRLDRGITNLVLRQPPITTIVTGTAPDPELTQFAIAVTTPS
jgi:hypothetical protein